MYSLHKPQTGTDISNKRLVLLLPWTNYLDVHLKKDTGLFPVYFSKEYNIPVEIVFFDGFTGSTKETFHRGVAIRKIKPPKGVTTVPSLKKSPFKFFSLLSKMFHFIKRESKSISHIMLFHLTYYSVFLCLYIKIRYPRIKIYIKMDTDETGARYLVKRRFSIVNIAVALADLVSCETKSGAQVFQGVPRLSKIQYVPNGIDDELYYPPPPPHSILVKERLLITVGNLFSYPKNTELLLDIIAGLHLRDWKVRLIGPLETEECDGFAYRAAFFARYPHLQSAVEFTGNISDRVELVRIMREATVFLFTSRWESFGIALLEAAAAGDYIISTDVGCAQEITKDGSFGFICPESLKGSQNEEVIKVAMIEHLQSVIDGKIDIEYNRNSQKDYAFQQYTMSSIVNKPCFKDFLGA
jgi:glycosyltransferase involved in cell wall biosynthesis